MRAVYLYCNEDWDNVQSTHAPEQDQLGYADSTGCPIYKFENGQITAADITSEEVPVDPDYEGEDAETETQYEVDWLPIKRI